MSANSLRESKSGNRSADGAAVFNSSKVLSPLTVAEIQERDVCEAIICNGWDTFLDVGRALMTVRNQRLYRDRHATFDEYCRHKWEFSKSHANRLIEAAVVASILTPIGVKPASESQLRPLVGLAAKQIPEAWKKAQQLAGDGAVTAKVVRAAAREFRTGGGPKKDHGNSDKTNAKQAAVLAALDLIDHIERAVRTKDTKTVLSNLQKLKRELQLFGK